MTKLAAEFVLERDRAGAPQPAGELHLVKRDATETVCGLPVIRFPHRFEQSFLPNSRTSCRGACWDLSTANMAAQWA